MLMRFAALAVALCLAAPTYAQHFTGGGGGAPPPTCTVAQLAGATGPCSTLGSPTGGQTAIVTDATGNSCTVGSSTTRVLCTWDAVLSIWQPVNGANTLPAAVNANSQAISAIGSLDFAADLCNGIINPKVSTNASGNVVCLPEVGVSVCVVTTLGSSCGGAAGDSVAVVTNASRTDQCVGGTTGTIRNICRRTAAGSPGTWRVEGRGGTGGSLIIAAVDASAGFRAAADYLLDGDDDDIEIQAAVDACEVFAASRAGEAKGCSLVFSDGTFTFENPVFWRNAGYRFLGQGVYSTHFRVPSTGCRSNDTINSWGAAGCHMLVYAGAQDVVFAEYSGFIAEMADNLTEGVFVKTGTPGTGFAVWDNEFHSIWFDIAPKAHVQLAEAQGLRWHHMVLEYSKGGGQCSVEIGNSGEGKIGSSKFGSNACHIRSYASACPAYWSTGTCGATGIAVRDNYFSGGETTEPLPMLDLRGGASVVQHNRFDIENSARLPSRVLLIGGARNLIGDNIWNVFSESIFDSFRAGGGVLIELATGSSNTTVDEPNVRCEWCAQSDVFRDIGVFNRFSWQRAADTVERRGEPTLYARRTPGAAPIGFGPIGVSLGAAPDVPDDFFFSPRYKGKTGEIAVLEDPNTGAVGWHPTWIWNPTSMADDPACILLTATQTDVGTSAADQCTTALQGGTDSLTENGTITSTSVTPSGALTQPEPSAVSGVFDGAGDFWERTDEADFDPVKTVVVDGTGQTGWPDIRPISFSWGAWVRSTDRTVGRAIIDKWTSNTGYRLIMGFGAVREVACQIAATAEAGLQMPDDANWHHLACSFNANTGVITPYLDGVPACSGACSQIAQGSVAIDNASPFRVGASQTGTQQWLGEIRGVFFMRRSLVPEEVAEQCYCGTRGLDATNACAGAVTRSGAVCSNTSSPTKPAMTFEKAQHTHLDTANGGLLNLNGEAIDSGFAGRSLTETAGSPDILDADPETYTDLDCQPLRITGGIPDTADVDSMWMNILGRSFKVTKIACKTDTGTATINLQRADGSPLDIATADLVCSTTGVSACASGCTTTIVGTEDDIADGEDIDLDIVSVASTPERLSVCISYEKADSP